MKARLMFAEKDFSLERVPRFGEQDLIEDLDLNTLWLAMAQGDEVIFESARVAILSGLTDRDQIRYRQAVLADCVSRPDAVREIYALAVQAVADEKQVYRSMFSRHGEALIRRSVTVLELYVSALKRLRQLAEDADGFQSEGFTRFFATLSAELDDDYFREVAEHLRAVRFRDGVIATARLGKQGEGIDYVLRATPRNHRLLRFLPASIGKPSFSWTVPSRDDAGSHAMGALRDRVLAHVAQALGQSTDHVTGFFNALRTELGFYVGCLNLHEQLSGKGEPLSMPDPCQTGSLIRNGQGLFDPCLSLRIDRRVQGNDFDARGKRLIMITGANQGGKSTFLRSVGLAQMMMQAGMFVPAERYEAAVANGVFTHYKREEDAAMVSGKFDEELARMSGLARAITTGDLLLCNESFAATNEREGSEIAGEVIRAMTDTGNDVVFVTHLYDLASRFHRQQSDTTLFLRAERDPGGHRSYQLVVGEPSPTSHGVDLYRETFAGSPSSAP